MIDKGIQQIKVVIDVEEYEVLFKSGNEMI